MIVDAIQSGVQIFDMRKWLVLDQTGQSKVLATFLFRNTANAIAGYQIAAPPAGKWRLQVQGSWMGQKRIMLP